MLQLVQTALESGFVAALDGPHSCLERHSRVGRHHGSLRGRGLYRLRGAATGCRTGATVSNP